MYPKHFTDQMGNHILLKHPPQRIVSLVPSQTELLFDLGLDQEIVGLSKFCIHPKEKIRSKVKIGGTKKLKLEVIRSLKPDLIIGNKEENTKEQIEALQTEFPVWMSDIEHLKDALAMIESLGSLCNRTTQAEQLSQGLKLQFKDFEQEQKGIEWTAAYFIWRKPNMVAGGQTFINTMLKLAGFRNAFSDQPRYPSISNEELKAIQPQVVLLSSEPFPFKEKHIQEFQELCPNAVIRLVDGELFSWYGSRLLHAIPYFRTLRNDLYSKMNLNGKH